MQNDIKEKKIINEKIILNTFKLPPYAPKGRLVKPSIIGLN